MRGSRQYALGLIRGDLRSGKEKGGPTQLRAVNMLQLSPSHQSLSFRNVFRVVPFSGSGLFRTYAVEILCLVFFPEGFTFFLFGIS